MVAVHKHHEANLSAYYIRLRNPQTGLYLHLSGQGEIAGKDYAWRGLRHQARTLRERARTRGEEWPYIVEDQE